ncbi:enoyl-CoA hydratase/isomerase family protein [Microbacterium aurum]
MTDSVPDEVLFERRGQLAIIRLNRPRAINALTHAMVRAIGGALEEWREDESVATVLIVGEGDRGLCAGGDVIALYRDVTASDGMAAASFWRDEYAMNAAIARYPKPIVAIQDGIVLGGGIGLSGHASHRVVTERSKLGFPEVTIGYIPDVGATWLLTRASHELGTRIALSAESVGPADAILVGLSDSFVPLDRIDALIAALEHEDADASVASVAANPPPPSLAGDIEWVAAAFSANSVPEIIDRLRSSNSEEARSLSVLIETKSPLALAVTLESLRRSRDATGLEAALAQEYRVSRHSSQSNDFAEGIRALLVDKDRSPRWQPAEHSAVSEESIATFFSPTQDGDLELHAPRTSKETS